MDNQEEEKDWNIKYGWIGERIVNFINDFMVKI